MPNWVINEMHVIKDSELDKLFSKFIRNPKTEIFNTLIPMPEELNNGDGWYRWRLAKWGTKWDVRGGDVVVEKRESITVYRFETAWNTPFEIFETLAYEHDGFINAYFADEDLGYNCGEVKLEYSPHLQLLKKFQLHVDYEDNKRFAIKLWRREDEFEIVNGVYEYKEW